MRLAIFGFIVLAALTWLGWKGWEYGHWLAAEREAAPRRAKLAKERLQAAEAVCKSLNDRMRAGEALTPTFIELYLVYCRRRAEFKAEMALDVAGQIAAWQEYKSVCVQLHREMRSVRQQDVSALQENQVSTALADVEYRLTLMTK